MNNFKRSLYTILLCVTCFIASPFIFMKIWKTSAEKNPPKQKPKTSAVSHSETSDGNKAPSAGDTKESTKAAETTDALLAEETDAAEPFTVEGGDPAATESPTEAPTEFGGFVPADASYFDDALFIGDSRTVGIMEYGGIDNADYFCSVGLSADKIDEEPIDGYTFEDKIDSRQYGKVYIMLGINEIGNDIEYTLTKFRAAVEKIKVHQPDAVVYLMANLHVAPSAETYSINNDRINELNSLIEGLADNKRTFYLDVNPLFDDGYGYLTESLTFDGVHVLGEYYLDWTDWLRKNTVPAG